jgi:hypothetical protein
VHDDASAGGLWLDGVRERIELAGGTWMAGDGPAGPLVAARFSLDSIAGPLQGPLAGSPRPGQPADPVA